MGKKSNRRNGTTATEESEMQTTYDVPAVESKRDRQPENVIEMIIHWVMTIVSWPFQMVGFILQQFTQLGLPGTRIMGAMAFFVGTLLGADNFWQLFGGEALFPWYEESWIGLSGYLLLIVRPWAIAGIAVCLVLSGGTQAIEGQALRGKKPDQAEEAYKQTLKYKLPKQPEGKIDLSMAAWKDYKKAGMRDRSFGGFIALALWAFDIISAFAARNPFAYTSGTEVVQCLLYVLFSILAGEAGYKLWRLTNDAEKTD